MSVVFKFRLSIVVYRNLSINVYGNIRRDIKAGRKEKRCGDIGYKTYDFHLWIARLLSHVIS